VTNTGILRGFDGIEVLGAAGFSENVGADQQQAIRASERLHQRGGVIEAGRANADATRGEIGKFFRRAGGGDDAGRRRTRFEQKLDDAAT